MRSSPIVDYVCMCVYFGLPSPFEHDKKNRVDPSEGILLYDRDSVQLSALILMLCTLKDFELSFPLHIRLFLFFILSLNFFLLWSIFLLSKIRKCRCSCYHCSRYSDEENRVMLLYCILLCPRITTRYNHRPLNNTTRFFLSHYVPSCLIHQLTLLKRLIGTCLREMVSKLYDMTRWSFFFCFGPPKVWNIFNTCFPIYEGNFTVRRCSSC